MQFSLELDYSALQPIERLTDFTNPTFYRDVPRDWLIALTDVRGSTKAIEAGRYKDVNALAAASITALLNVADDVEVPFVFGGDGASVLIPPKYKARAIEALVATKNLARDYFDMELRVGLVPVEDVVLEGYAVRVAKLRVSENFEQAIFSGGGVAHAEFLFKHPRRADYYAVTFDGEPRASFEGFECRWNAVPSTHDETVSLLVNAQGDADQQAAIYDDVLRQLEMIYGSREQRHPISPANLHLAMEPKKLMVEAKIRYQNISMRRLLHMLQNSMKAAFAMRFNISGWGSYKQIFMGATDHEKFDDALRMTISGTEAQREQLVAYLKEQYMQQRLAYGVQVSTHALVTCIVFDYFGRQVHFVDADGGGYALASKQLKAQLDALRPDHTTMAS